DAPGLRSGEKMADHATSCQNHRILGVGNFGGRCLWRYEKSRLPIGEIERSRTLRYMVQRCRVEEPRRARMALRWTRPKDDVDRFHFLPTDCVVIRDPTARSMAQFLHHLFRPGKGEATRASQRLSDILNNPPVLPCVPWTVDDLVNLDY